MNLRRPRRRPSHDEDCTFPPTTTNAKRQSGDLLEQQQRPSTHDTSKATSPVHTRRWSFPNKNHHARLFSKPKPEHARVLSSPPSPQDDMALGMIHPTANNNNNNNNLKEIAPPDAIVTRYYETPTNNSSNFLKEPDADDTTLLVPATTTTTTPAPAVKTTTTAPTAILQHSYYLEQVCGCGGNKQHHPMSWDDDDDDVNLDDHHIPRHARLSEDPTVQESIECVFASQLEQGLPQALWDEEEEEDENRHEQVTPLPTTRSSLLLSPASLLQSRASSRSNLLLSLPPTTTGSTKATSTAAAAAATRAYATTTKTTYQTASLVHMGTLDHYEKEEEEPSSSSPRNKTNALDAATMAPATTTTADQTPPSTTTTTPTTTFTCPCCSRGRHSPCMDPTDWPQAPLLLKPTPNSGTRIIGVRYSGDSSSIFRSNTKNDVTYLWKPNDGVLWNQVLLEEWGRAPAAAETNPSTTTTTTTTTTKQQQPNWCEHCCILPINNGNEESGKSLVIDFESEFFVGSLLLRLRHSEGTTPQPYNDQVGYFLGMNRRYQAVVQGRFKQALPWTSLVTGFQLDRPCGKLPPKWILKSALKVVSFFAPQLDAKLDVDKPSSLTPLGSTPQVIAVHDDDHDDDDEPTDNKNGDGNDDKKKTKKTKDPDAVPPIMDIAHVEPLVAQYTLLGQASDASTSFQRSRYRKRAFDKLYVQHQHYHHNHHDGQPHSPHPLLLTQPDKIYTMEFLQHLFNFQDFSMELGSMLGSVKLKEILDGQPIQFMACISSHNKDDDGEEEERRRHQRLWSFDIWHSSLMEDAKKHDPGVQ